MTEKLSRTQRRQKETRERIFRVAMELFQQKGFEQTTVAEIAEAADIGKGTFFTYFPTKEAVFSHLGAMLLEVMDIQVAANMQTNQPVANTIKQVLAAAAIWHEQNRALTHGLILASMNRSSILTADLPNQQRFVELIATVIRTGQERGEISPRIQSEDAAIALTGIYFAVVLAWATEDSPRTLNDRMAATLDILLEGLLARV